MAEAPKGKAPKLKTPANIKMNPRLLALLGIVAVAGIAYVAGTFFMQPAAPPPPPPVTPAPPAPTAAKPPATPATKPAQPPAKPAPTAAKPAAPAPAAPMAPAAQPPKGAIYAIQVHTLYKKASAEKAVEDLKAKGFDAYMAEKTISTEKTTLRLTGYKSQEEASADADVLKNSKVVASPTVEKVAENDYAIVAGTYSGAAGKAMASKLKLLGYSVSSQVTGKGSVQVYMVRVGHYATKADAQASAEMAKIKEMKLTPMVVDP